MSRKNYPTLVFGFISIAFVVVQLMNLPIPPIVGWPLVAVFGALAILFIIKGIHKKESLESLILTPRTYRIGLSGMSGMAKCPDKPEGAYWLCLDVSTNAVNKAIDTLDLIIEGKTIHANQWDRKIATSFPVCFNVTDWKGKSIIQVDLRAHIEGDGYSIARRPIDFDIEPGGFPQDF